MTNFIKCLLVDWRKIFALAVIIFLPFMFMCFLCGCKTVKYVPVETVRTEYIEADTTAIYNRLLTLFKSKRENSSRIDSLIDREKETVVLNVQGDTVKLTRTHYIYVSSNREKELEIENNTLRDSVSTLNTRLESVKNDSIPVPYPVERELSRWERTKMDFGGIAFGGVGASVVIIALLAWLAMKRRK
ncbi:MAG: hypothetical protein K2H46_07340 [Muribaculaceae bacterium]|nr:hypothetical protein [Muribaculaceae bacterium]